MRNDQRFGRFDLVDMNHYTFSRNSGLPLDHFKEDMHPARGIFYGSLVGLALWAIAAMLYAAWVG
jgi:hypothetical protein